MFTTLPKDVIWMIIKQYLFDMLSMMPIRVSLHTFLFNGRRAMPYQRWWYERTLGSRMTSLECFVDWLYPLRLVCKRLDSLLKEKITRVPEKQLPVIRVAM